VLFRKVAGLELEIRAVQGQQLAEHKSLNLLREIIQSIPINEIALPRPMCMQIKIISK
jgi:hypothetical protein